jgi:predicted kinase
MVIVVYGLPGTGKSWLSRRLAREFHAIHLNTDIVRDELGKKGDYSQASRYQVYGHLVTMRMSLPAEGRWLAASMGDKWNSANLGRPRE